MAAFFLVPPRFIFAYDGRTMDAIAAAAKQPAWAYDFCYYYFAMAAFVVIYSLWALIQLFSVPGAIKRMVPTTTVAIAILLSGALSTVLVMMNFWICRASLKPAATEKFAVKCAAEQDCTAVMGTPQGDLCSCGGRGLCGGCVMRNDMEPSMLPEYGESFAPVMEGFRVAKPAPVPRR